MKSKKEALTKKEIKYITGQLAFAQLEKRLLITPYGQTVLNKLYRIINK